MKRPDPKRMKDVAAIPHYVDDLEEYCNELEAEIIRLQSMSGEILALQSYKIDADVTFEYQKNKIDHLEAENARLREELSQAVTKWYNMGRESGLRENRNGCCCAFDEDGETVIEPCLAHKTWLKEKILEGREKTS